MENIQLIADVRPVFADLLSEALKERGLLIPITHVYLVDLLVDTTRADDDQNRPLLPSEIQDPLLSIIGIAGTTPLTGDYKHYKRIGDGILLATAYWPKSISPAERKARPPVEFYAGKGAEVYSLTHRLSGKEVFGAMSSGFIQYAGALRDVMAKIAEPSREQVPITEIVIADEIDIERFSAKGEIPKKREKN